MMKLVPQVIHFIRASRESHSGELVLVVRPNGESGTICALRVIVCRCRCFVCRGTSLACWVCVCCKHIYPLNTVQETCTKAHDQNCVVWLVGCVWKFLVL